MRPILRRQLRLPRHRATTAHLCAAYPFLAEAGLGARGVYLGTNILTGGSGFAFDPFEAYQAGVLTNPNMLLAGEPGTGKSSTAKIFIHRSVGVFGRWVAIADPKGEYLPLASSLGLSVIKLHPGGTHRLNPLDAGPAGITDGPNELARRQTTMLAALLSTVLQRDLSPVEDAVLGWAITHLARTSQIQVTVADVAKLSDAATHLVLSGTVISGQLGAWDSAGTRIPGGSVGDRLLAVDQGSIPIVGSDLEFIGWTADSDGDIVGEAAGVLQGDVSLRWDYHREPAARPGPARTDASVLSTGLLWALCLVALAGVATHRFMRSFVRERLWE